MVVGAGVAGGTTALLLGERTFDAKVTLIERDPTRLVPQPHRPVVRGSVRGVPNGDLQAAGVDLAIDEIVDVDWHRQEVLAFSGRRFPFDHLVVAPGIAARDEGIEGYGRLAAYEFPHAWAGGGQAERLQAQIEAMPDGGVVIVRAPAGPHRYLQGPYVRARCIARYLAQTKPRGKVIVLDAKDDFPQRDAVLAEWATEFPGGTLEWIGAGAGGEVTAIDVAGKRLLTSCGWISGNVINFIPAQQAGTIAQVGGMKDATGWCPVEARSLRSRLRPDTWILGDANDRGQGSKTAESALNQARLCADSILSTL